MSGDHRLWAFLAISLPFLAARARPRLGFSPFLAAPGPRPHRPLRHLEGRGSDILPQLEPPRPLRVGRACALLLPSCEDTSHTLASPECTSGPASALRHGAEQGSGLTSEPKFALLWMGTGSLPPLFAVVHKRDTAAPFPLLFPLFAPNFAPRPRPSPPPQGAPWERGQGGRVGGTLGSGPWCWARWMWALLGPPS